MENYYNRWWGINEQISPEEIIARAGLMFLVTFIIIRITGMRPFRENNPFDLVTAFLIGGILSRGVVGATPFLSALAGAVALIILHKFFLKLSLYNKWFEDVIKGKPQLIYKNGRFIRKNMRRADITKLEVFEDLRVDHQTDNLDGIEEIYVEKTGEISFVKKTVP